MGGSPVVRRSYVWGLDLASSLSATGGVGALMLETLHTAGSLTAYSVASDGNGNVTALVDANGAAAALYEYDAFGQLLRADGTPSAENPAAADTPGDNPFRFSTKYWERETHLVYYGHRFYDPSLGRFLNRDPSGEAGGANLYAFVRNNPINGVDYLGHWSLWEWLKSLGGSKAETAQNDGPMPAEGENSGFNTFWHSDGQDGPAYYSNEYYSPNSVATIIGGTGAREPWHHGIPKATAGRGSAAGNGARAAGIDVNAARWGWTLPTEAHTGTGGVHSNSYYDGFGRLLPKGELSNGVNRNWSNEWDQWYRDFTEKNGRNPTEKDYDKQFKKMRDSKYYREAFKKGKPSTRDYDDSDSGPPSASAVVTPAPGAKPVQVLPYVNEDGTFDVLYSDGNIMSAPPPRYSPSGIPFGFPIGGPSLPLRISLPSAAPAGPIGFPALVFP